VLYNDKEFRELCQNLDSIKPKDRLEVIYRLTDTVQFYRDHARHQGNMAVEHSMKVRDLEDKIKETVELLSPYIRKNE